MGFSFILKARLLLKWGPIMKLLIMMSLFYTFSFNAFSSSSESPKDKLDVDTTKEDNVINKKNRNSQKRNKFSSILSKLNLSEDQKILLKELNEKNKNLSNNENLRSLKQEMEYAFASNSGEQEVRKIQEKINNLMIKKSDDRFNHLLGIRNILNPEQRKGFLAQMEKKRSFRKGRRGNRNRGGQFSRNQNSISRQGMRRGQGQRQRGEEFGAEQRDNDILERKRGRGFSGRKRVRDFEP